MFVCPLDVVAYPVASLHAMTATALVTVGKLSLNVHLIAFVMAAYSAAVVAVKYMSTNGSAAHQNVATLARARTGSAEFHRADARCAGQLAGNQEISCVDSVRDYWAEEIVLVHNLQ